jgi:FkbM family methyltransferase
MLIKLSELIKNYNIKINGILHIGAHLCEELEDYLICGINNSNIIWIEANPNLVKIIKNKNKNIKIFNYLVSDVNNSEVIFNISNNGQSSSMFDLGTHKIHHPHIHYISKIKLKTLRLDTIYANNDIPNNFANFLNMDIQGAELVALKGMGDLLDNFDYLYLEVNKEEVYKSCPLVEDIDEYLKKWNFKRVQTSWKWANWGDAFYIKNYNN